jgi:hypothetical protein
MLNLRQNVNILGGIYDRPVHDQDYFTVTFSLNNYHFPRTGNKTYQIECTVRQKKREFDNKIEKLKLLRYLMKNDKQDHQGKAAFNERNPHMISNKNQWQGAQADPKRNQGRAKTEHGQVNHLMINKL